jgi:hypothetical protein
LKREFIKIIKDNNMLITYLHLILNHIPIIGTIVLFFLFAHAVIYKKDNLVKVYFWFFAVTALITIPVFLTGDPSSEYLKAFFPGVNNELIEDHETFGYLSLIIILILGASGLTALRVYRHKEIIPKWFKYSFLVVSFICVLVISWTGKTGGEIRHNEIIPGQTTIK